MMWRVTFSCYIINDFHSISVSFTMWQKQQFRKHASQHQMHVVPIVDSTHQVRKRTVRSCISSMGNAISAPVMARACTAIQGTVFEAVSFSMGGDMYSTMQSDAVAFTEPSLLPPDVQLQLRLHPDQTIGHSLRPIPRDVKIMLEVMSSVIGVPMNVIIVERLTIATGAAPHSVPCIDWRTMATITGFECEGTGSTSAVAVMCSENGCLSPRRPAMDIHFTKPFMQDTHSSAHAQSMHSFANIATLVGSVRKPAPGAKSSKPHAMVSGTVICFEGAAHSEWLHAMTIPPFSTNRGGVVYVLTAITLDLQKMAREKMQGDHVPRLLSDSDQFTGFCRDIHGSIQTPLLYWASQKRGPPSRSTKHVPGGAAPVDGITATMPGNKVNRKTFAPSKQVELRSNIEPELYSHNAGEESAPYNTRSRSIDLVIHSPKRRTLETPASPQLRTEQSMEWRSVSPLPELDEFDPRAPISPLSIMHNGMDNNVLHNDDTRENISMHAIDTRVSISPDPFGFEYSSDVIDRIDDAPNAVHEPGSNVRVPHVNDTEQ